MEKGEEMEKVHTLTGTERQLRRVQATLVLIADLYVPYDTLAGMPAGEMFELLAKYGLDVNLRREEIVDLLEVVGEEKEVFSYQESLLDRIRRNITIEEDR